MSESGEPRPGPRVLARSEHPISRSLITESTLKVLYRLHRSGFTAYLVGGAVRDLLLGRRPKDFDVGTNARPQQVRQLFRNARLIGRRFRLARVIFTGEVVEVATFRRSPDPPEMEDGETSDVLAPTPEANEYGTPEEDARRRDFTVNGLFYDIASFAVIDHVGGLEDLRLGVIRTIGPVRERFGEDPVRMLRAIEYSARLGFRLDEGIVLSIEAMRGEIHRAAPARIAYELLESLKGGQALPIFRGLENHGLLKLVLPEATVAARSGAGPALWDFLERADETSVTRNPLTEETLLALLVLPGFLGVLRSIQGESLGWGEVESSVRELVSPLGVRLALSNHRAHVVRNALLCLARLAAPPRAGKRVARTVRQEGFATAWRLAGLLNEVAPGWSANLGAWEQAIARVKAGLPAMPDRKPGARRRRAGRPRRRSRHDGNAATAGGAA